MGVVGATIVIVLPEMLLATNVLTDGIWPGFKRRLAPFRMFQFATGPLPEAR